MAFGGFLIKTKENGSDLNSPKPSLLLREKNGDPHDLKSK
jgi:hypothetical protein